MTHPPPPAAGSEATAQQLEELAAMRRMLEASRGTFSLSVAVCNSPSLRDYLIGRLREPSPDIAVVSIAAGATDPFGVVSTQLSELQPDAVFVTDLERVVPSDSRHHVALRALNASRELWDRRFRCPVVFWLPQYAATLLATEARDLWRYRSHRFEFVSEHATASAGKTEQLSGNVGVASNLSQDEKQFRIAELEQRISEAGDPPAPSLVAGVRAWLNELAVLHYSLGRLEEAEGSAKRLLEIATRSQSNTDLASAYTYLGHILDTRGDLAGPEVMCRQALAINEKLGRPEGMANDYGNLGNVLQARGDLDGAEAMYRKSLAIDEKLGRPRGVATAYDNLGLVLEARGDLNGAEAMHRKSLAIEEKLGRLEYMANQYANLGNVLQARGDLDGAEAMYRKALAINEKLGRPEGMANDYGSLGVVQETRGDLDGAHELWTKSRDLFAKIGAKHMAERVQGWIDELGG